jgi:UDP-glucuronate decarboxylase
VVSNFIVHALKGEDVTIYGDGTHTRSFCYVDDLVDAMLRAMETPDEFTGPVNIGNPGEFTMLQLAELVLKLTDSKSRRVFKPLPSDDPRQRRPDLSLAKAALGWSPTTELEQGLGRTIRYFKDCPATAQRGAWQNPQRLGCFVPVKNPATRPEIHLASSFGSSTQNQFQA